MGRLRISGQSIIEYVVILLVVALASVAFLKYVPKLFVGYEYKAREDMKKG